MDKLKLTIPNDFDRINMKIGKVINKIPKKSYRL